MATTDGARRKGKAGVQVMTKLHCATIPAMGPKSILALVLALAIGAGIMDAKKKPKAPDQDSIVQGCVIVDEIHFQPSAFYNTPGLRAIVHNNCDKAADVMVKVALFDAQGTQLDGDSTSQDIAPRAAWSFFIPVPAQYLHGLSTDVKMMRIIRVLAL